MKFKKIILITLLLLAVLTISSVSANDNLTDEGALQDAPSEEIKLEDANDGIVSSSQKDMISEKDDGTFTALQKRINDAKPGSTIYLENDYLWDDSDYESVDDDGIYVGDDIIIEGNGHIINASGKTRIMEICSAKVTLNNIQFCNGKSDEGGAIYVYGSTSVIRISNCVFANNLGLTKENYVSDGGALFFKNGGTDSLTEIINCIFKNNKGFHGGAIYVATYYEGTFNIRGSIFTQNQAYYTGGAIDWWSSKELNIYDSEFKENQYDGVNTWAGSVIIHDGIYEDLADEKIKFVTTPKSNDKQSSSSSSDSSSSTSKTTKLTPKLTVKKATFKVKVKTKKYTAILKTNKNKAMKKIKLYLKVKGKTYTAKTNNKGKAIFKIKNLKKKGTYKATVTFKGNSNYNKVTKTVKIKVK